MYYIIKMKFICLRDSTDISEHPTQQHIVRLLSFLPGEILFSVPYTKELFFQVGELVAKTDLALMVNNCIMQLNCTTLKCCITFESHLSRDLSTMEL